jgi:hypothetical protein
MRAIAALQFIVYDERTSTPIDLAMYDSKHRTIEPLESRRPLEGLRRKTDVTFEVTETLRTELSKMAESKAISEDRLVAQGLDILSQALTIKTSDPDKNFVMARELKMRPAGFFDGYPENYWRGYVNPVFRVTDLDGLLMDRPSIDSTQQRMLDHLRASSDSGQVWENQHWFKEPLLFGRPPTTQQITFYRDA